MAPESVIYVVDDDRSVRDSIRWLLESASLKVVTCESAREFLEVHDPDRPGCVLLDVRMPGMSGLELQEKMVRERLLLPIIIVTGHGDVPMAVRSMKAGAFDFIEKPFDDEQLLDRIQDALRHDVESRQRRAEAEATQRRLARLTPREVEVMEKVVAGRPSKRIAVELGVSEKTVEVHRAHIMLKMQAENVADLVRMVLEAGSVRGKGGSSSSR